MNFLDMLISTSAHLIDFYKSLVIDFGSFSFDVFDASILVSVFSVIWYHFNGDSGGVDE